jgi:hypothetical protein
MYEQQVVREAPITPPFKRPEHDSNGPPEPDKPMLATENIQGDSIGFNKDHQTLLFLIVTRTEQFRNWLGSLIPFIATAAAGLSLAAIRS